MTRKLTEVSVAVGLAALLCNFLASGFTADNVLGAADAAVHGPSAAVGDYLTVATVFFATAPIVLATLASWWAVVAKATGWSHFVIWAVAAVVSNVVLPAPYAQLADRTTTVPFHGGGRIGAAISAAIYLVRWFTTAYGVVALAQGVVVGLVAVGTIAYLCEKWSLEGSVRSGA